MLLVLQGVEFFGCLIFFLQVWRNYCCRLFSAEFDCCHKFWYMCQPLPFIIHYSCVGQHTCKTSKYVMVKSYGQHTCYAYMCIITLSKRQKLTQHNKNEKEQKHKCMVPKVTQDHCSSQRSTPWSTPYPTQNTYM